MTQQTSTTCHQRSTSGGDNSINSSSIKNNMEGHDRRVLKKKTRKSQRRRSATSKKMTTEALVLSFSAPIVLWMVVFCLKGSIYNQFPDDNNLQNSKSAFFQPRKSASPPGEMLATDDRSLNHPAPGLSISEEAKKEAERALQEKLDHINKFYNSRRRMANDKEKAMVQGLVSDARGTPTGTHHTTTNGNGGSTTDTQPVKDQKILTAFMEPPFTLQEDVKPLPPRKTAESILETATFPKVHHCSSLIRDFGKSVVDNFPSKDPFLPWIHDFFPTNDGTMMKFIGQNKRNCETGEGTYVSMRHWKPQIALFQPVPVVMSTTTTTQDKEPSFRLADSFEHATAKETRFICRFHNSSQHSAISLSGFPFNYEFVTWRKNKRMLEDDTSKNSLNQSPFWLSQLLFSCPIPPEFQPMVRQGKHVVKDVPKLWVDVIPIRTPPRSNTFLLTQDQIGKEQFQQHSERWFQLNEWFGKNHTLPKIADSGRWANLPICHPPQPTTTTKPSSSVQLPTRADDNSNQNNLVNDLLPNKKLVACTWASASYHRRGNAVTVRDSHARLREWIIFHQLVGFDHFYIYDNSPIDATSNQSNDLEAVVSEFPSELVTYIRWPCTVCSNNRPMHKNPGDRSSQYAAEASCRERFGPFTEWMSALDTDEYLVPMKHDTWREFLVEMENKGVQVLKMKSSRGLPRHDLMESLADQRSCEIPQKRSAAVRKLKQTSCQEPMHNETFLKVYNCDYIKPPRPSRFARAMKQIYRPSYVLSHYVHYSTVTEDIALSWRNQSNVNSDSPLLDWKVAGSTKEVFLDELTQGTLIHARLHPMD
ncbi:Pfam:DUF23 [Seminavis robusta]|uniref:Pfam:DUF23 n=1 Tax=Seminavis robusta TaxID=568900 RepID=A0A9N8EJ57_9STRA|nr:Pfam:DUF23 [Seminavis robusta]|eukprot:Sro1083_g239370.1 Pfam:DUF23 (818) ;mRNA; r:18569-21455